jgi:EmrB/QacA subfamily drug resistance transporter
LLVQSGLLLTFGRLGDMIGHRRVYLAGLLVFIVSLVLCVLAPSVPTLILARMLQAAGGAMFTANSSPILTVIFPPRQRGRVLGIQSTTVYLGSAAGAPLGGILADQLGWQSVFLIPLPFALLALLLSWRALRIQTPPTKRERFDLVGASVYLVGLVLLLLSLNRGESWGWLSAWTLGCCACGLLMLTAFVLHERRTPFPMLSLSLFARRAFTAPVISSMMNYSAASTTTFLVPFALIEGRGLTPSQVGLVLTWQPIVMAVTASISGALSDKIGSRIPTVIGMCVLSTGLYLLSRMHVDTPLWLLSAELALIGLGIGLFTSPNNSAVLGAVGPERRGVASGILSTARTLGNVLGIGSSGAIYATVLASGSGSGEEAVGAASAGLVFASCLAALGAVTSATRPGRSQLEA